jgi:hypothetical protein
LPVHVLAALLANPEDWHAGTKAAVAIASLLLHLSFPLLSSSSLPLVLVLFFPIYVFLFLVLFFALCVFFPCR